MTNVRRSQSLSQTPVWRRIQASRSPHAKPADEAGQSDPVSKHAKAIPARDARMTRTATMQHIVSERGA